MSRQRCCAGGCNAVKTLGSFYEAERPSPVLQDLGRQILSLTCGSGLFLGAGECESEHFQVQEKCPTPPGLLRQE